MAMSPTQMRASLPPPLEEISWLWRSTTPSRITATAPRLFMGTGFPNSGLRKTPATMVSCHRETVIQEGPKSDAQVRGA